MTRTRARFEARLDTVQKDHDARVQALDALLRETEARHDQVAAQAAAVEPFFAEMVARIANGVRSRSLAFVEGALAALPEGAAGGSIADIAAMREYDIRQALLTGGDGPA